MSPPLIKTWVLSLDGGGVRGLSSLIILNQILEEIESSETETTKTPGTMKDSETTEENPESAKKRTAFQLVCGTSAGGLSAIMIGRLGLTIPECIEKFKGLSAKIFRNGLSDYMRLFKPKYDGLNMTAEIENLLDEDGEDKKAKMHGQHPHKERRDRLTPSYVVCVNALEEATSHPGETGVHTEATGGFNPLPILFGTERSISYHGHDCDVSQAARATSAAPTYFEPETIEINGIRTRFLDGGLHYNNPIHTTVSVIRDLGLGTWNEDIGYISIGTGMPDLKTPARRSWRRHLVPIASLWPGTSRDIGSYCRRVGCTLEDITDQLMAENAHEAFKEALEPKDTQYFRFNCDAKIPNPTKRRFYRIPTKRGFYRIPYKRGSYRLRKTKLDEPAHMVLIERVTEAYLMKDQTRSKIARCVESYRR